VDLQGLEVRRNALLRKAPQV
jgi:hypothetical protein